MKPRIVSSAWKSCPSAVALGRFLDGGTNPCMINKEDHKTWNLLSTQGVQDNPRHQFVVSMLRILRCTKGKKKKGGTGAEVLVKHMLLCRVYWYIQFISFYIYMQVYTTSANHCKSMDWIYIIHTIHEHTWAVWLLYTSTSNIILQKYIPDMAICIACSLCYISFFCAFPKSSKHLLQFPFFAPLLEFSHFLHEFHMNF